MASIIKFFLPMAFKLIEAWISKSAKDKDSKEKAYQHYLEFIEGIQPKLNKSAELYLNSTAQYKRLLEMRKEREEVKNNETNP